MTYSDNVPPSDRWTHDPAASPDSGSHLDKIRHEVVNAPAEQPKFYGLDIGIVKLGFTSDGAFNPGINLGLVHAQAKVGLVMGADAGVGLGPVVGAGAGVYVGADQNGFHGQVGAGAHALGLAEAHAGVDTRLGNATGADVHAGAHLGPLGTRGGVGVALGQDGFDAAAGGGAHLGRAVGVRAGGNIALGDNSQIAAGAGGHIGDLGIRSGAGVWTDGDSTVRPDVYLQGRAGGGRGSIDINPPGYNAENPYANGGYGRPAPPYAGLGQRAPIEVRQLPPPLEAATPENVARVDRAVRTKLSHDATYIVQPGDNYKKIAGKLMPGADAGQIDLEASKLKELHEANGYRGLHAGQRMCTEDIGTIDLHARQMVARHFGQPIPLA